MSDATLRALERAAALGGPAEAAALERAVARTVSDEAPREPVPGSWSPNRAHPRGWALTLRVGGQVMFDSPPRWRSRAAAVAEARERNAASRGNAAGRAQAAARRAAAARERRNAAARERRAAERELPGGGWEL